MSARRLIVLIRQLPIESATVRSLNGGRTPWGNQENLLADLWALKANTGRERHQLIDHPVRTEMQAKAKSEAKLARVIELRSTFEERKQRYGLG